MKITIKYKGREVELLPPKSLATCMDFVACWGAEQNRTKLSRLCAAAIGDAAGSGKGLPSYDITAADPYSYGHGCLEVLLGSNIPPSTIYDKGTQILALMADRIPSGVEVDNTVNFTNEEGSS